VVDARCPQKGTGDDEAGTAVDGDADRLRRKQLKLEKRANRVKKDKTEKKGQGGKRQRQPDGVTDVPAARQQPDVATDGRKKKTKHTHKSAVGAARGQDGHEKVQGAHKGRKYTVSIALPGSIMTNAQSPQLRSYLAGQIARALAVFSVDEVIVFREDTTGQKGTEGVRERDGGGASMDPCMFLARLLQYLDCPQYLRKAFFPMHRDLQHAGLLNPLVAPHHMVSPLVMISAVRRAARSLL